MKHGPFKHEMWHAEPKGEWFWSIQCETCGSKRQVSLKGLGHDRKRFRKSLRKMAVDDLRRYGGNCADNVVAEVLLI